LGGFEVTDLLLDTHIWIWLSLEKNDKISTKSNKAISSSDYRWISAISCWELAKLVEKKRIGFSIPLIAWIRRSLNEFNIRVADLSPEIAVESTVLRDFHKDPADQIIVATARILSMRLVTADRQILDYPDVDTLW
jgi:PIN domain nuclease of toxin-antitoxin system